MPWCSDGMIDRLAPAALLAYVLRKHSVINPSILKGAAVVITRPSANGRPLLARVRALGGYALSLPGIALRASDAVTRIEDASHGSPPFDIWVFTSPNAVRFTFLQRPAFHIRKGVLAVAVGGGTARALARHGLHAIAPTRADSEGLLALPELADVRGRRVALVGAPGGRDMIAPELRRRGAEVEAIHVYERVPPRLTRRHFDALARAADPLVMLVSSAEALRNLVALLPVPLLDRLRRQRLVASSDRLEALANEHGFANVTIAASALADDLIDAACQALASHRS